MPLTGTVVNKRNALFEMEPRTDSVHIIRVVMPAACERSPKQAPRVGRPLRLPCLMGVENALRTDSFEAVSHAACARSFCVLRFSRL